MLHAGLVNFLLLLAKKINYYAVADNNESWVDGDDGGDHDDHDDDQDDDDGNDDVQLQRLAVQMLCYQLDNTWQYFTRTFKMQVA